mmetsp:Transcript_16991/g.47035  ORF Transcript_16991/g.47035 Transcript_16991/m.47035 type:complete len:203 (+) Transcript_16991:541-1149(+)
MGSGFAPLAPPVRARARIWATCSASFRDCDMVCCICWICCICMASAGLAGTMPDDMAAMGAVTCSGRSPNSVLFSCCAWCCDSLLMKRTMAMSRFSPTGFRSWTWPKMANSSRRRSSGTMGLMLATYSVRSGSSAVGTVAASAACAAASPRAPPCGGGAAAAAAAFASSSCCASTAGSTGALKKTGKGDPLMGSPFTSTDTM